MPIRPSPNTLHLPGPRYCAVAAVLALALLAGCNLFGPARTNDAELEHYKSLARSAEEPAPVSITAPPAELAPRSITAGSLPEHYLDLTVLDAVQIALSNSTVLRDLGGNVLRFPDSARTILAPSIVAADPRFGMEAALSEFDAVVATSVFAEKNDRQVNNFVASGGARVFQQDLVNFQSQISKVGVAGTRMTLRGKSLYDFNNASFNRFPSVWDSLIEAEFRQPLYQGYGSQFNRIAGPSSQPGVYNGVLIARVNSDASAAEFEMAIRDLVSNVENAYWDLYFAYRDLDAKVQLRNSALEAWKLVAAMRLAEQAGGKPEREAQAREQYFRYQEEVQNALAGRLQDATNTNNGSSGGSFRGLGGVLVAERRLRLAMGLPINGEEMLRPLDEPTLAKIALDWPQVSADALTRRPELARQRLLIKRRELEYVASRNFLLPRFDVVGRYRYRGLGKGLYGEVPLAPGDPDPSFGKGSIANLVSGDFQEWQLGGEVTFPIGYRKAYAGVRQAQLGLAREKAVLEEQQRQVVHDLSNTLADLDRAHEVMQTAYNRRLAAVQNVELLREAMKERPDITPEQLLDAARRQSEAEIQFHKAQVEHMLAVKNVHFEKGTLLEYCRVALSDKEQFEVVSQEAAAPQSPADEGAAPATPDQNLPSPPATPPEQAVPPPPPAAPPVTSPPPPAAQPPAAVPPPPPAAQPPPALAPPPPQGPVAPRVAQEAPKPASGELKPTSVTAPQPTRIAPLPQPGTSVATPASPPPPAPREAPPVPVVSQKLEPTPAVRPVMASAPPPAIPASAPAPTPAPLSTAPAAPAPAARAGLSPPLFQRPPTVSPASFAAPVRPAAAELKPLPAPLPGAKLEPLPPVDRRFQSLPPSFTESLP